MKKALWLLLLVTPAALAVRVVVISDPVSASTTHCGLLLASTIKVEVPVGADAFGTKICQFDLDMPVGNHSLKATTINRDTGKESDPSPVFRFKCNKNRCQ